MKFTIGDFNGPLDLLLHLVKESKMDIYEVSLDGIIGQYIDFIHEMERINIDVASEYLVYATELIHLKSKMLLNQKDKEDEESELGIDTEEDLRNRLLEYQRYKEVCASFKELESKRGEVYTKVPENLTMYKDEVPLSSDTTIDDLTRAFNMFLERQKYIKPLPTKITKKEISVEERTHEIRNILRNKKRVEFFELFESSSKPHLVVTFLTILEMAKLHEVSISQEERYGNIIIEASD